VAKHPNMPAFVSAAQGYDAVQLIAAAIRQANSTDGEKVQQALENLGAVQGIIKLYNKPFSKEQHEALGVADFHLAQWKDGRVIKVDNAIVNSLTAADLKR
jgi:branched-chain amino acid transport system substrate-binding protein